MLGLLVAALSTVLTAVACGVADKGSASTAAVDAAAPIAYDEPLSGVSCTRSGTGLNQDYVITATAKDGAPLTLALRSPGGDSRMAPSETITRAGQVILSIDHAGTRDSHMLTIGILDDANHLRRLTANVVGTTVSASLDGHPMAPFSLGTPPSATTLLDGAQPAGLSISAERLATIRAIGQVATQEIPVCGASPAAKAAARAATSQTQDFETTLCNDTCSLLGDSCSCCSTCCAAADGGCSVTATLALGGCAGLTSGAATVVCVLGYIYAVGQCDDILSSCNSGCAGGSSCCGPACGAGTATQACTYPHCSAGASCCNGLIAAGPTASNPPDPGSSCCNSASDCCGGTCLEGIFAGGKCLNNSLGTFCFGPAGDICGSNCCEPNTPVCRVNNGTQTLCCATGAGDVCNNNSECCPSATPNCLNGTTCCGPNDVVCSSTATECCPPPGTCVGGGCCNPPSFGCNGQCCSSGQTCTSDGCCGGMTFTFACGSHCCATGESCLNGECCPSAQTCGSACCSPGQACVSGACTTCSGGTVSCQQGGSPAFCCAPGVTCSSTGCCATGTTYCATTGECAATCPPPMNIP